MEWTSITPNPFEPEKHRYRVKFPLPEPIAAKSTIEHDMLAKALEAEG
jgi:hypothetical protein